MTVIGLVALDGVQIYAVEANDITGTQSIPAALRPASHPTDCTWVDVPGVPRYAVDGAKATIDALIAANLSPVFGNGYVCSAAPLTFNTASPAQAAAKTLAAPVVAGTWRFQWAMGVGCSDVLNDVWVSVYGGVGAQPILESVFFDFATADVANIFCQNFSGYRDLVLAAGNFGATLYLARPGGGVGTAYLQNIQLSIFRVA